MPKSFFLKKYKKNYGKELKIIKNICDVLHLKSILRKNEIQKYFIKVKKGHFKNVLFRFFF